MGLPFIRLYPRHWQSDAALRSCSATARGVWIELVCIMSQNENGTYGYLCPNGRITEPLTESVILRLAGLVAEEYKQGVAELEQAGVFSRTEHGVMFCRFMLKEIKKINTCRENGRRGGNPRLSDGISDWLSKSDKLKKLELEKSELEKKGKEKVEKEKRQERHDAPAEPTLPTTSPAVAKKKKARIVKPYGGGDRVMLTEDEFNRLIEDFGMDPVRTMIEKLDLYLGRLPERDSKKYADHNLTIRAWFLRDGVKKPQSAEAQEKEEEEENRQMEEVKKKLVKIWERDRGIKRSNTPGRTYEPTEEEIQMALDEMRAKQ